MLECLLHSLIARDSYGEEAGGIGIFFWSGSDRFSDDPLVHVVTVRQNAPRKWPHVEALFFRLRRSSTLNHRTLPTLETTSSANMKQRFSSLDVKV